MKRRLSWILPLVFVVWNVGSVLALTFLGTYLPVIATNILSLSFLPFLPLLPILKALGLVAGYDSWTVPSIPGYILSLALYSLILFALGRFFQRS